MIFINPSNITFTTPPAPIVLLGILQFTILLDTTWTFPPFVNWEIQQAILPSKSSTMTNRGNVAPRIGVSTDTYFHYRDVDPNLNYSFRYRVSSKSEVSDWSALVNAGYPKFLNINPVGYVPDSNTTNSGPQSVYVISEM